MLIAQITDCHIVEKGKLLFRRVDTATMLRNAIDHINRMSPRPELVLATGDLVNAGRPAQYEHLVEILADLAVPLFPIPGNHDDRSELRERFPQLPPGGPDEPIDYVVDDHDLRLIGLDTSIPGRNDGQLSETQMAWLDLELAQSPDKPTLVFQHHPPFVTGIDWMDRSGLTGRDLEANVVGRHAQVGAIVCGHIHRPVQALVGGAVATTWPSTGAQVALALDGTPHLYVDEQPAVALHQWQGAQGVVSHTSYVNGPATWIPPWVADGSTD